MIISIDFDGTIVEHRFPEIGELKEGAKEVINWMVSRGHSVAIWTCRSRDNYVPGRDTLQEAIEFLNANGIKYHSVNDNVPGISFKPFPNIVADVYIDDKNLGGIPHWFTIKSMIQQMERN